MDGQLDLEGTDAMLASGSGVVRLHGCDSVAMLAPGSGVVDPVDDNGSPHEMYQRFAENPNLTANSTPVEVCQRLTHHGWDANAAMFYAQSITRRQLVNSDVGILTEIFFLPSIASALLLESLAGSRHGVQAARS